MDSKNKLFFSAEARSNMSSIYDYISNNLNNNQAAEKLTKEFIKGFKRIQEFPKTCQTYGKYRRLVVKKYLVFYEFKENEKSIIVHGIYYGQMDYEKFL